MGCRLSLEERTGWPALVLSNEVVKVVVLPDKGAEVYEFVDLVTGTDVLFKSPWGLQPPGAAPRTGSGGASFLANYGGGWQELFPSVGDECVHDGRTVPFHGEVALRPWSYEILAESGEELVVQFSIRCHDEQFELTRVIRLASGSPTVVVDERVVNLSAKAGHFVWGHHCVLGPPFIEDGCRFDLPATWVVTPSESWEDTVRLRPGQRSRWPLAEAVSGPDIDLRRIPGPQEGSHDDVYLTGLQEGTVRVHNPRLELTFTLAFDPALFRWVVSWQPFGGARAMPLAGSYALGVEPWTSNLNLEEAVGAGDAVELAGNESLDTRLTVSLVSG